MIVHTTQQSISTSDNKTFDNSELSEFVSLSFSLSKSISCLVYTSIHTWYVFCVLSRTTMWSLESIWKKSFPHQIRQKWANHDISNIYPLFILKKTLFAAGPFVHLTWKQLVIADTYIRLFDFEYSVGLVLHSFFLKQTLGKPVWAHRPQGRMNSNSYWKKVFFYDPAE